MPVGWGLCKRKIINHDRSGAAGRRCPKRVLVKSPMAPAPRAVHEGAQVVEQVVHQVLEEMVELLVLVVVAVVQDLKLLVDQVVEEEIMITKQVVDLEVQVDRHLAVLEMVVVHKQVEVLVEVLVLQ